MEPEQPKQTNKVLIGIIVVVLLAVATAAVVYFNNKNDTQNQTASETTSTNTTESSTNNSNSIPEGGTYKDGSYEGTGSYQTPGGTERVTVKVTLADGVIESVDMERDPTTREAEEYQGKFVSGYKSQVVGKNIDDVRLNRVAGSSLTSGGFNQALEQIKSDAQV